MGNLYRSWSNATATRPTHAQPFHGEKELFDSDHADEIHKSTIIGKCHVHTLQKYESLSSVSDNDFFTRFMYRPGKKEFEPDQVCKQGEEWVQNAE